MKINKSTNINMAPKGGGDSAKVSSAVYKDKSKPADIRLSNINAAKGIIICY